MPSAATEPNHRLYAEQAEERAEDCLRERQINQEVQAATVHALLAISHRLAELDYRLQAQVRD